MKSLACSFESTHWGNFCNCFEHFDRCTLLKGIHHKFVVEDRWVTTWYMRPDLFLFYLFDNSYTWYWQFVYCSNPTDIFYLCNTTNKNTRIQTCQNIKKKHQKHQSKNQSKTNKNTGNSDVQYCLPCPSWYVEATQDLHFAMLVALVSLFEVPVLHNEHDAEPVYG